MLPYFCTILRSRPEREYVGVARTVEAGELDMVWTWGCGEGGEE
jgi:hypothetical protein